MRMPQKWSLKPAKVGSWDWREKATSKHKSTEWNSKCRCRSYGKLFRSRFKKKKNEGDYTEQQTFKVGETAFYWKKMPSRTFIDREERSVSDFKGSKDRLTLLLGTIMQLITWNWSQCSFAILKTPGPLRIMPKLFCLWLMNGTTKPEWQHLFL